MKKCLNPSCGKKFKPGHYGDRQKVCADPECRKWYKMYLAKTGSVPRGIATDDYKAILDANRSNRHKYTFLVAAYDSALRKGELLGLLWSDILDHAGRIRGTFPLRGQWSDEVGFKGTKSQRPRVGFFTSRARKLLAKLYQISKSKRDERIFPWWESSVWRWFTSLQKRLKIANPETGYPYRVHDIRHARLTEVAKKDPVLAKRMAGHAKIETTMRYAERRSDDYLADLESLNEKDLSSRPEDRQ